MKEPVLTNCEKSFVLQALSENRRLDGRALDEFRPLKIYFGSDWGCCFVNLGETKVIAQVSCEVQQPKPTRPNEGLLLVYVELSPMGAPHFEAGRQSNLAVQLNRLLEKCIKDSRCVDLESLCITAEEKVWAVRVDVSVLNHEGNLVDAASVAALTALTHFRRPDVTTTGEQTIIHDPAERDPIPITLHHHPVCVSYAVFDKGNYVVVDPTAVEERVSEGQIVYGVNAYRELCGLHLGGSAPLTTDMVRQYAFRAAKRALEVVTQMKKALAEDAENRKLRIEMGFRVCIEGSNRLSLEKDKFCIQLFSEEFKRPVKGESIEVNDHNVENMSEDDDAENEQVVTAIAKGSAQLTDRKQLSLNMKRKHKSESDEDTEEESQDESSSENSLSEIPSNIIKRKEIRETEEPMSDSEIQFVAEIKGKENKSADKVIADIELSGDSEEEETVTLCGKDLEKAPSKTIAGRKPKEEKGRRKKGEEEEEEEQHSRGWYSKPLW